MIFAEPHKNDYQVCNQLSVRFSMKMSIYYFQSKKNLKKKIPRIRKTNYKHKKGN